VSDVIHDTTEDDNDDVSDNDANDDKDEETDADVFFWAAQEIMNWSNKKIGTATMEERQFCSFFGIQKEIILKVWGMLGEGGLHPENSEPKHLLWALYFLKVYPRRAPDAPLSVGLRVPSTLRPCGKGSGSF
jgi:hypothetical protein